MSIIIPTFNRADLIVSTLERVRAQTFSHWECLVVDDGSTDETPEVVAGFVARDGRFRYVTHPCRNVSALRNHGARLSHGRYLAFLDSDDLLTAEGLAEQVLALDQDADAAFAYGEVWYFDHGDASRTFYTPRDARRPSGAATFDALLENGCVSVPLVRREAFDAIGGFDETLDTAEDWDLFLALSKIGRVIHCPSPALLKRRHAGNKSGETLRNYRGVDVIARKHLRGRPLWTRVRLYRAARRFFRAAGWLDALLDDANRLNEQDDWARARVVWRAAAHLEPRLLWRVRVMMNVGWALVPTKHPPPWRPLWRWMQKDGAASPRRHRAL